MNSRTDIMYASGDYEQLWGDDPMEEARKEFEESIE